MSQKTEFHNLQKPDDGLFRKLAEGQCAAVPLPPTPAGARASVWLVPHVPGLLASQLEVVR